MKKTIKLLLALTMLFSLLTACSNDVSQSVSPTLPESSSSESSSSTSVPEEPEEVIEPYMPSPLTGEFVEDTDYVSGRRLTAVMINNISKARPQSGHSDASILFEIKVEGGITRFMGLYENYEAMADKVGPIRSARDQFWRLIAAWQPFYLHDGASVVQSQYIKDYQYEDYDLNQVGNYTWRSSDRVAPHNEYTDAESVTEYLNNGDFDLARDYKDYTFFNFEDYRDGDREFTGGDALRVTVEHSSSYISYFNYNADSKTYEMSQYNGSKGTVEKTIDTNNNKQLDFKNLVVLFTEISTYKGHESTDLQYADYNYGGVGFIFSNGKYENVRWSKGSSALETLKITDNGGNEIPVTLNPGKSYVAIVDLDEYDDFVWYTTAK